MKSSEKGVARVAAESDDFVRMAPYPVTNVSPAEGPMPPVPDAAASVADPAWRPKALTDRRLHAGSGEAHHALVR